MLIKTEKELCEKFVAAHPRNEYLYFEVHVPGGRCDILHKENKIITIYEAKLRLSIELLEQCINRKPYCHFVYAIVPYKLSRNNSFLEWLFSEYGIGIITLRNGNSLEIEYVLNERSKPKLNRSPKAITIYEENKKEIPGIQHSGITPFQIMVKNISEQLRRKEKCSIDEIFKHQNYYGTLKQFKTNIYQWIRQGVIENIEMQKGMMWLKQNKPEK